MDSIKDLAGLCALLTINIAGWAAGLSALLGVLPIPHTAHDWGLTLGSAVLFILGRIRDHKRVRRRLRAVRSTAPVIDAPASDMASPPRAVRRRQAAAVGLETHSAKMRKTATH